MATTCPRPTPNGDGLKEVSLGLKTGYSAARREPPLQQREEEGQQLQPLEEEHMLLEGERQHHKQQLGEEQLRQQQEGEHRQLQPQEEGEVRNPLYATESAPALIPLLLLY